MVDPDYVADPWLTWPLPPVLLHDWGRDAAHPKVPLVAAQAGDAAAPGAKQPGDQDGFGDGENKLLARPAQAGRCRREGLAVKVALASCSIPAPMSKDPRRLSPLRSSRSSLQTVPGLSISTCSQRTVINTACSSCSEIRTMASSRSCWRSPTRTRRFIVKLLGAPNPRPLVSRPSSAWFRSASFGSRIIPNRRGNWESSCGTSPDAIELLKDVELELGDVANLGERIVKNVVYVVTRSVRDITAVFQTGAVLVDLRGNDEKLPGTDNLTDPGELLLLTNIAHPEKLQLVVLNEAEDRPTVEAWEPHAKCLANPSRPREPLAPVGASRRQ